MTLARFPRQKSIGLACQLASLRSRYEGSRGRIKNSYLNWECNISPSPLSCSYGIEIIYTTKEFPKVWISGGALTDEDLVSNAPHQYGNDLSRLKVEACLSRFDWNTSMLIADTIVPWAMEWAIYYEIWKATGLWVGDEAPHPLRGKSHLSYC